VLVGNGVIVMPNESEKWPLVSVVIVNYNGKELLQQCMNSALNSDYPNFEAILVDNGSTDGSVKLVKELFGDDPRVKLILNGRNLGAATGRNMGSRMAKGEYLAFLDNDTKVDSLWLKEAIGLMERGPTIGAIQCKLLLMNERDKFDYAGDYLSQYGFLIQRASFGEVDNGQLDKVAEIFSAKSAGMIVRRDVFNRIGGFDEDYFVYVEETDLCWRIWLNGYRVVFVPTSIVYHAFGNEAKLRLSHTKFLSKYHGTKNYITTLIKNLDTWNLLKILPLHIGSWIGITVWHIMRKRLVEASWVTKGALYNLTHFRCIWMKRKVVQSSVRKVPDSYLLPRIMRKPPFTYFFGKLTRPKRMEGLK
jgi:hypothetical protein